MSYKKSSVFLGLHQIHLLAAGFYCKMLFPKDTTNTPENFSRRCYFSYIPSISLPKVYSFPNITLQISMPYRLMMFAHNILDFLSLSSSSLMVTSPHLLKVLNLDYLIGSLHQALLDAELASRGI